MLVYAIDDESLLLDALKNAIAEAEPFAEIHAFSRAKPALQEIAGNNICPDVIFIDVEMPEMSGLEFARCIKGKSPKTNIVFVTGFRRYAAEAAQLYMSGYVMKPVDAEKIRMELDNLRYPIQQPSDHRIRVQCFGNFEVFCDDKPLVFRYSKTKELFAYLIDRKGASIPSDELIAILWEDRPVSASLRSQLRNSIADLGHVLKESGFSGVLAKSKRSFNVNPEKLSCDYYQFIKGDVNAVNTYRGEYMAQYSWAEMTTSGLTLTVK